MKKMLRRQQTVLMSNLHISVGGLFSVYRLTVVESFFSFINPILMRQHWCWSFVADYLRETEALHYMASERHEWMTNRSIRHTSEGSEDPRGAPRGPGCALFTIEFSLISTVRTVSVELLWEETLDRSQFWSLGHNVQFSSTWESCYTWSTKLKTKLL